jgi:hypothetical protein
MEKKGPRLLALDLCSVAFLGGTAVTLFARDGGSDLRSSL